VAGTARAWTAPSLSPPAPRWGYIIDFACPAAKLVIELDGGQHASSTSTDEMRTRAIAQRGYRVIRFWNGDVLENQPSILLVIRSELDITPSAPGGGEGRGEVEGAQAPNRGQIYLTLPVANATGPLPLPPKGRRGRDCN
jgi:hypothetical protein